MFLLKGWKIAAGRELNRPHQIRRMSGGFNLVYLNRSPTLGCEWVWTHFFVQRALNEKFGPRVQSAAIAPGDWGHSRIEIRTTGGCNPPTGQKEHIAN
jgi:hypothetical protein